MSLKMKKYLSALLRRHFLLIFCYSLAACGARPLENAKQQSFIEDAAAIEVNAEAKLSELCPLDHSCVDAVSNFLSEQWAWQLDRNFAWGPNYFKSFLVAGYYLDKYQDQLNENSAALLRKSTQKIKISHITLSKVNKVFKGIGYYNHVINGTVYVNNVVTPPEFLHELGHVVDNKNVKYSFLKPGGAAVWGGGLGDKMLKDVGLNPKLCFLRFDCRRTQKRSWKEIIADLQGELPPTSYAYIGPSEDFADSFKFLILGELKSKAEKRFEYFEKIFVRY